MKRQVLSRDILKYLFLFNDRRYVIAVRHMSAAALSMMRDVIYYLVNNEPQTLKHYSYAHTEAKFSDAEARNGLSVTIGPRKGHSRN